MKGCKYDIHDFRGVSSIFGNFLINLNKSLFASEVRYFSFYDFSIFEPMINRFRLYPHKDSKLFPCLDIDDMTSPSTFGEVA